MVPHCSLVGAVILADRNLQRPVGTMRFGSTAKVLLKCKLKYYRISECVGLLVAMCLMLTTTGYGDTTLYTPL